MIHPYIRASADKPTEPPLQYRHLTLRGRDPSTAEILYLGYPLLLSAGEFRVLRCLMEALNDPASHGCADTARILAALSEEDPPVDENEATDDGFVYDRYRSPHPAPSESDDTEDHSEPRIAHAAAEAAVYIRRINQKAGPIGGRKLILRHRRWGYLINPYM